jgi:DNA-binding response OmpR family regulator
VNFESRGDSLYFSVRDFGEGIPEAFRSRVFEKFAQGGDAAHHSAGTGLGLSITQKMVEAMGGDIRFETETGMGTTFTFCLPRAKEVESREAVPVPDREEAGEKRVLICEDDADVATLLKLLLERAGYPVHVAHTLAEARRKLAEHAYAAMTLDLMLPDGDGLEFLRELRASTEWGKLPVVVVSVKAEQGRRELSGDPVELVDWISKPIDEGMLKRVLTRAAGVGNAPPRILHVEDDLDLRQVLGQFFQGRAEWIGASTLQAARALLEKEHFDLIVLDVELPDGSGLQLLEELNTHTGHPIPVLILSGNEPSTEEDIRKRVAAILLKSRTSEEHVVETVLGLIRNRG